MHEAAERYDEKTESIFEWMQIFAAGAASFAHGANDVANAIAPLASVFAIWEMGNVGNKASVSEWILAYGGVGIDLGLFLFGYRLMRNLGNNLTYLSPLIYLPFSYTSLLTLFLSFSFGFSLSLSSTQPGSADVGHVECAVWQCHVGCDCHVTQDARVHHSLYCRRVHRRGTCRIWVGWRQLGRCNRDLDRIRRLTDRGWVRRRSILHHHQVHDSHSRELLPQGSDRDADHRLLLHDHHHVLLHVQG